MPGMPPILVGAGGRYGIAGAPTEKADAGGRLTLELLAYPFAPLSLEIMPAELAPQPVIPPPRESRSREFKNGTGRVVTVPMVPKPLCKVLAKGESSS